MGKISFFLKEAFGSLRRNYFMTIAALVTVFLSIVVLGGVLVFVFTTDALLEEVEQKVRDHRLLQDRAADPTPDQMTALQTEIRQLGRGEELSPSSARKRALERMQGVVRGQSRDLGEPHRQPAARLARGRPGRSRTVDEVAQAASRRRTRTTRSSTR